MDQHPHISALAKHRIEAFSDGIYAIAITLLVLDVKLPALPHGIDDAQLLDALHALMPRGLTWLLSFYVIAIFWLAQQRLYRLCSTIDTSLVWLELAQLALISLFPFSNALMGEYGEHSPAAVIYAGHLLGLACLSWLRTAYFLRHVELHAAGVSTETSQALRLRAWVLSGCALAAVLLGFIVPAYNMLAMLPTALLSKYAKL